MASSGRRSLCPWGAGHPSRGPGALCLVVGRAAGLLAHRAQPGVRVPLSLAGSRVPARQRALGCGRRPFYPPVLPPFLGPTPLTPRKGGQPQRGPSGARVGFAHFLEVGHDFLGLWKSTPLHSCQDIVGHTLSQAWGLVPPPGAPPPPCLCPPTVPSPWTPAVAPGPQCARARQGHGWPERHTDVGPRQGAPAFPPDQQCPVLGVH